MGIQEAQSLVRKVLSDSPNAEQLNALRNRIHDQLIVEKDAEKPGTPEPFEGLIDLILQVIENQISPDEALKKM